MDIPFPSLAQTLSSHLLHGFTTSLLAFSHLLSFQRCESTCGIFEKPISWPFFQTLLLLSSHPKSPILLPSSLLLLFSYFLVFSFYSLFSSFFLLFLLLFLPPWLFLLWSLLLSILLWTPCHLYFSYSSVNFKVMASKQWHLQNYTLLLTSNHINFCSLSVFLIINVYLYCIFMSSSLLNIPSIFLMYIGLFIFFNLNPYFLANFKLITNLVILLSNNTSTITSSCISIIFSPIFTVTSFNMSSLSRLQQNLLFITLESIANLL